MAQGTSGCLVRARGEGSPVGTSAEQYRVPTNSRNVTSRRLGGKKIEPQAYGMVRDAIEGGLQSMERRPRFSGRLFYWQDPGTRKVDPSIWPKERSSGSTRRRATASSSRMMVAKTSSCTTLE